MPFWSWGNVPSRHPVNFCAVSWTQLRLGAKLPARTKESARLASAMSSCVRWYSGIYHIEIPGIIHVQHMYFPVRQLYVSEVIQDTPRVLLQIWTRFFCRSKKKLAQKTNGIFIFFSIIYSGVFPKPVFFCRVPGFWLSRLSVEAFARRCLSRG